MGRGKNALRLLLIHKSNLLFATSTEIRLMQKEKFILCPVCGNKTRVQIREDTELKNFPLFCPKCHKQTLINAKQLNITKAEVPDAKTQSR